MTELLILLTGGLLLSGVPLFAAFDASRMKEASFSLAGQKKQTWVVVLFASAVFLGVGLLATLYYLVTVRPKVASFERDPNRPTLDPH